MTAEQITQLVLEIAPSLIAILTMIGTIAKVLLSFRDLKKQVVDMKCIDELKEQMSQIIQENYELKKTLNETMTKIDHVRRD